jgi:hypothetical protein
MAERGAAGFLSHGVASNHTEAGLEGGHLAVLGGVGHVVDGHTAVLLETYVGKLRDALKGRIIWGLEVKGGCPVVAKVLGVGAGCAG